jgi:general secretion pathway protein D
MKNHRLVFPEMNCARARTVGTDSGMRSWNRFWSLCCSTFVVAAVLFLSGCASTLAYREGNKLLSEGKTEQGLAKLEEATNLDPNNAEYRIAFLSRKSLVINRLNSSGEAARRESRFADAEKAFRQALTFDANNQMAKQGLDRLVMERRHREILLECEELLKKGTEADLKEALTKLRPVLSENPQQKQALNLKARIDEVRAKEHRPEIKLAASFRKPISLEFRDAPLRSVFEVLAKVSGLNFFYDKDIRPDLKATIYAKNTSVEDALRLLLVTNQLEQKVLNENSILIYPNTPQKLKDYQTLAVRSFYLSNADVKAVSNSIKTILKTKDMVVDERLGIIIMRDTPEAIRMAERIVALQDLRDPEVMLEVEVLEIKRSRLMELGIQWPSQVSLSPLQFDGVPLVVDDLRHLNSRNTQVKIGDVLINARKEDQDANILANPRIRVRNKEKAKILIGDRVPVITTTSTSTGFVSESVNYVDVGLKLEVEPNIYLDEEVAIKVNLEVSSVVREIVSKSGTLSYQIGTRGANTVLQLKDGETQILAGLISDEDRVTANKVPGIGEMPVVGRLFGSQKDDAQRSEILLSITPHVVRSIRRPDLLTAEFDSGTESAIGADSLRLSTIAPAKVEADDGKVNGSPVQPTNVNPTPVNEANSATSAGAVNLAWQGPAEVKVGEQFSAVLKVNSQAALRGLPVLVGFDPQVLQVVSVQEGDFFKQGNGQTNFSQRIDPTQGKIFATTVRQNASGTDAGVNGTGGVITINFKAIKQAEAAKVQLLSASPEPPPSNPVSVPLEQILRINP